MNIAFRADASAQIGTGLQYLEEVWHDARQFYWGTANAWLQQKRVFSHEAQVYPHILMLGLGKRAGSCLPKIRAAWEQLGYQVKMLLEVLNNTGNLQALQIMDELNLKHRPTFRENYLHPALEAQLIEMTIPEKPRSSKQRYRLTRLGQSLLANDNKGSRLFEFLGTLTDA